MFKRPLISFALLTLLASTAFAFSSNAPLADQIESGEGTTFSGDQLELATTASAARKLFINPHFPTERDMYLVTDDGVFLNRQYAADFSLNQELTDLFPNGPTEIKFVGTYTTHGMMLAYDPTKIYISYNRGQSWSDITPADLTEDITFADFGPNYAGNNQIYFITDSGLYRKSMSSGAVTQLVESTAPGSVKNFRYIRTTNVDSTFYVVNGKKLLKTENFGDTWLEYEFDSDIVDFEYKQKTATGGHLMVLVNDKDIYYSTLPMTFFKLDVPAEINKIFAVDYIIYTDQGFYITYNNGESWSKLDYDPTSIAAVSDYDFVYDGTLKSFYVVNNGALTRDYNLNEVLEDYMTGVVLSTKYLSSGIATSANVLDLAGQSFTAAYAVTDATLFADGDLNDQTMTFEMTADGVNWEDIELGTSHTFEYPGLDLKWRVTFATADPSVTPVLRSVNVDYGVEELNGCAGFADVPVDDPHCPALSYVKSQGIFGGYPDGTFKPDQEINRAETVKVIIEGFNLAILTDDGTDLGFSDVEVGSWYMDYLKTALEALVIEGYPDGTYKPSRTVNYAEMLKIFFETSDAMIPEAAAGSEWYQKYVDYANANNLVPYPDVTAGMKRVDVAELFYQWSLLQ